MVKIPEAFSIMNGIFFCSEKTPQLGVFSYISNEEIITKRCDIFSDTIQKNMYCIKNNNERINWLTIIFLSIICCVSILNMAPQSTLLLGITFYLNRKQIDILLTCFVEAHCKKECKNVYRLHSAEHCLINYYNKHGNLPNALTQISYTDMFSKKCSLYNYIYKISLGIIFSIFSISCPNLWFFNFFNSVIILNFLDKMDILKYLEIIYLKVPTALELKIAYQGIHELIEMNNDQKIKTTAIP